MTPKSSSSSAATTTVGGGGGSSPALTSADADQAKHILLQEAAEQTTVISKSKRKKMKKKKALDPDECIFCDVTPENDFRIEYEDDEFICFHDIDPHGPIHLLVIPREHIANVDSLDASHLDMVKRMAELGKRLLRKHGIEFFTYETKKNMYGQMVRVEKEDIDMRRLGFHLPPYRSVDHLHLHCIGLPLKPFTARAMFPTFKTAWYAPVEHVIDRLEKLKFPRNQL